MQDISEYAELVLVRKQSAFITDALRKQYKDWHLSKTRFMDKKQYACHHIIGLSLGGSNNWDNLVVMTRKDHERLHRCYLDPMVQHLKEGQECLLLLPKDYNLKSQSFKMYDMLYKEMMAKHFVEAWKKARLWEKEIDR